MPENLYTPNSIRVFTGKYINLIDPDPATIFPSDIAIGLARECRWGNHCKRFYSVAEHSIECMNAAMRLYPDEIGLPFQCLIHDAPEAYLKDIPSPLKNLIPEYEKIEENIQRAICKRFGVSYPHNAKVKEIDKMILEEEWQNKMLRWSGFELTEQARVDLYIHHFVKLCKHPFVLQP